MLPRMMSGQRRAGLLETLNDFPEVIFRLEPADNNVIVVFLQIHLSIRLDPAGGRQIRTIRYGGDPPQSGIPPA